MTRHCVGILLLALLISAVGPADASECRLRHHKFSHASYALRLPPERHVIEVTDSWGFFVINRARFTPKTRACWRWVAGDQIRFLAGDMHGYCDSALIYNVTRRQTSEVWC